MCKLDNGETGKCSDEKDCPSESGHICGYFGNIVAVCCPIKNSAASLADINKDQSTRQKRAVGDLSISSQ